MSPLAPRVLLTNDDGRPGPHSPYVYGLYSHLVNKMGWNVKVVLPASQKSWIGGAFQISDVIQGTYYYPAHPDGNGESSPTRRDLKEGEVGEWILLETTPATCANIALNNLFPGEIDLVISGPNLGCNASAAYALASGTIGAAMSSSLCKIRSVAVSYGTIMQSPLRTYHDPAHALSCNIIKSLWEEWGVDEKGIRDKEIDLYNVNIPMVEGLLDPAGLKVVFTHIWRNGHPRMFKQKTLPNHTVPSQTDGPNSVSTSEPKDDQLRFVFSPEAGAALRTKISSFTPGSDAWAIFNGYASITPLRASLAEAPSTNLQLGKGATNEGDIKCWTMKL